MERSAVSKLYILLSACKPNDERIAKGSGTTIQEVNKLVKQYENALTLFKRIKKGGGFSKLFGKMR